MHPSIRYWYDALVNAREPSRFGNRVRGVEKVRRHRGRPANRISFIASYQMVACQRARPASFYRQPVDRATRQTTGGFAFPLACGRPNFTASCRRSRDVNGVTPLERNPRVLEKRNVKTVGDGGRLTAGNGSFADPV